MNVTDERYRRIEAVYQDVLDTPLEQRSELLDKACQGDDELRREVETLLSNYEAAPPSFLDRAAHSMRDMPMPERIGRYRILAELGRGGMGIVYRAEQESPRREVAVKVMRWGVTGGLALHRFELEAAILGRLKHPGIAQIYEAGVHDDSCGSRPFFAMELVEGAPLTSFAQSQGLDTSQRLALVAEISDAVHYAHQRGLVHRDIKPANILVTQPTISVSADRRACPPNSDCHGRPTPKILDFGVALTTDSDIAATTMHTEAGQLVGTLPYMSPEQLAGDVSAIDIRSDVYSLGVILYELLCGTVPFDVTGKSIAAAARIITEQEAFPPGRIHRAFRGDLDTIVLKVLEKNPDRRFQSASELAADLRRYLQHEPITARPATAMYQLSRFARRNRGLVAGLFAAFVVLIAGLIGTSYGLARAVRAKDAEVQHRTFAEQSERAAVNARDEAQAVTLFLIDMLRAAEPQSRSPDITVREVLDRAASTVDRKFAGRPLVEARIRYALGASYSGLDLVDQAQMHISEAAALFQREKGERDRETLMAFTALTHIFNQRGESTRSEAQARATLEVQRRVLGEEDAHTLLSMANLARALEDQGRYSEAEALIRKTAEAQNRRLGEENAETLESMNILGNVLFFQGRYAESEAQHRKTLEIRRRVRGEDHATTLNSMHDLANAINAQGRFAEAEDLHRQTLDRRRRVIGEAHPHTLFSMDDLAKTLCNQHRFTEAEGLSRQALTGLRRAFGNDHRDTIETMRNLAVAIQGQGRFDEPQELLLAALESANKTLGEQHPMTLDVLERLAELRLAMGSLEEAEQHARQCLESRRRVQGELHPDTAAAMHLLARICLKLEKYDESENLWCRALEIRQQTLGPDSVASREVADSLRDLYHKLGRTPPAGE